MSNQNMPADRMYMTDSLTSQKQISSAYNTFAGECTNQQLRDEFLNILKDEHCIQSEVFCEMQKRGWYSPEQAEQQKINQAKTKFTSGQ